MKAAYLDKVSPHYRLYFDYAEASGIIDCDHQYIPNQKSYGYRFTYLYRTTSDLKPYPIAKGEIKKNVNARNMPPKYIHLYKWFEGLEIDIPEATRFVKAYRDSLLEYPQYTLKIRYPK
ncbi:MAG TPA: hypothetical protein VN451_04230, partial [Chitinophagaceae bacterium]|nr:hypothetical protein [Chitinophagaceae bacterium]